jgi:hypothetical protein
MLLIQNYFYNKNIDDRLNEVKSKAYKPLYKTEFLFSLTITKVPYENISWRGNIKSRKEVVGIFVFATYRVKLCLTLSNFFHYLPFTQRFIFPTSSNAILRYIPDHILSKTNTYKYVLFNTNCARDFALVKH